MKVKQKKFNLQVTANLCYYAEITADSFEDALAKARQMGHDGLWKAPGDIIDTEYEIEGVSKA
jgi:hypothetical protein